MKASNSIAVLHLQVLEHSYVTMIVLSLGCSPDLNPQVLEYM